MSRSRTSRVGRLYLPIWLISVVSELAVAHLAHKDVAGVGTSILSTLAAVYLTWGQLQRSEWSSVDAAEALAEELLLYWGDRRNQRTFNVQAPLRISWDVLGRDIIDDWVDPVASAESAPDGFLSQPAGWTARANALDSAVLSLRELLSRVPAGRLVVLGEKGAGKTILLVEFVRRLLEQRVTGQRNPGDPVPVLVSLASWNQKPQSLSMWLENTLINEFKCQSLSRPIANSRNEDRPLEILLKENRLLLVLDGLDEMLPEFRRSAIAAINKLDSDDRIIVSSRIAEYHAEVVSRVSPIQSAVGIRLRTLDAADIKEYLSLRAGNAGGRWDPVLDVLSTPGPVADALSTPLMVNLARTIYNPDPSERRRSPPDPAELVDLPDVDAIERHLFQKFIDTAYREAESSIHGSWRGADARRWLEFLARHQERQPDNKVDFDWWELSNAPEVPRGLVGLIVGLISALAAGLAAGLGSHVGSGFGLGLGAGIILALMIGLPIYLRRRSRERPLIGLSWGLAGGLLGGLGAGVAGMLGVGHAPGLFGGLAGGIGVGVGAGAASGRLGGFLGCMAGGLLAGTLVGVGSGWPAGVVNGLGVGLGAGTIVGLAARPKPANKVQWSQIGLLGGLAAGVAVGLAGWRESGPDLGLLIGLVAGLAAALASGMARRPAHLEQASGPSVILSRDRRAFAIAVLSAFCTVGPVTAMLVAVAAAHQLRVRLTLRFLLANGLGTGVAVGLVCGLVLAFVEASWGSFAVSRAWLAARRHLPLRLDAFLSDAHHRDILRRIGARYQFRHRELQRYLAGAVEQRQKAALKAAGESESRISSKDFLHAPTELYQSGYRLARPSSSSEQQLYPYIGLTHSLSGGDATRRRPVELCARWYARCPDGFMHLEKYVDGHWRPIAVSIILPLSRDGYRAIVRSDEEKRVSITDLDSDDILNQFETRRRFSLANTNRYLLIDTWIVDQAYRGSGHGKVADGGGYANTLILKHVSVFWNSANGFRPVNFLAATSDSRVTPVLKAMTFKQIGKSATGGDIYETDTSTLESVDDIKLDQIQSVITELDANKKTDPIIGTAPQPSDWAWSLTGAAGPPGE